MTTSTITYRDYFSKDGGRRVAGQILDSIKDRYPEARTQEVYQRITLPSGKTILAKNDAVISGGCVRSISVDVERGLLSPHRMWFFVNKPVVLDSNSAFNSISKYISYTPKGETGDLLVYVRTKGNLFFSSGLAGGFGIGVTPSYVIICYEDLIREACESVASEINDGLVTAVLTSEGKTEDKGLRAILELSAKNGGNEIMPGVKVISPEKARENRLI